jgi:RecA-family ATPase
VRNNTTLLYGDAGVGKTTFYLYLADALMNGSEFAGIRCERCKPLIVCQDEDHSLLKNHWARMGKTGLLPVAKKDIVWDRKEFNEDFEMTLRAYRPDVVFIDSYTSLGIPDITRPESGSVFDATNRMARKHGCAVILIHHTNLSGEQMGSSLHRAKVSSMVSIVASNGDHIVATQEKVRGSHFEPIVIRFNRESLSMEREEGSLREEVWRLLDQNVPANAIIEQFPNRRRATITRYVREHTRLRNQGNTGQGG